jgi:hypothetical protein
MEDWLRPVVGTDGGDDPVHVDAKTGEVNHGLHSTDASNRGLLPFGKGGRVDSVGCDAHDIGIQRIDKCLMRDAY